MAALNGPRLRMRGVSKRFGATQALDGVDLEIGAGETHALVGENGAGKSTLMKILSGAETPDSGQMWLDGKPFRPPHPLAARRRGVAMIYQELSLAPHLTVEQNISLGMEPGRLGWIDGTRMRRRAVDALSRLNHADIAPELRVAELPLAARQVVEIARALAVGCRVLVLDEPTSSLSRRDVEHLFALVRRLASEGHTVVYISHFLEEVRTVTDRFTVLRDGRTAGTGVTADVSAADLAARMVGRRIEQLYPRSPRQPGEAVLSLRSLAGRVKPLRADLDLHRGEVFGVAGLVGAGRTELLRAVFGLEPVRRGNIRVGLATGFAPPHTRIRQGLGFLSEDRKGEGLAQALDLADNVTLSRLSAAGRGGFVSPAAQRRAAARWIERLGIRCRNARQAVAGLSGGNQQKVAMARLLHQEADVLLLDEPTRGVDVASKAEIYRWIDDLACGRAGGAPRAVLVVSSYLPELLGICDRIAVMCRGTLGPPRDARDCTEHQLMLEATGQEAA
jgi:ribose transport system ATP-binding protein